jgi:hypothetical protein
MLTCAGGRGQTLSGWRKVVGWKLKAQGELYQRQSKDTRRSSLKYEYGRARSLVRSPPFFPPSLPLSLACAPCLSRAFSHRSKLLFEQHLQGRLQLRLVDVTVVVFVQLPAPLPIHHGGRVHNKHISALTQLTLHPFRPISGHTCIARFYPETAAFFFLATPTSQTFMSPSLSLSSSHSPPLPPVCLFFHPFVSTPPSLPPTSTCRPAGFRQ